MHEQRLPSISTSPLPMEADTWVGPITWERALTTWEGRLQSPGTRKTYKSTVRMCFGHKGMPTLLKDLTIEQLDAYAGVLRRRADKAAADAERIAPSTANTRMAALRSFLTFCRKRRWLAPEITAEVIADALQAMRGQVRRPYQIVEGGDEWDHLLEAAASNRIEPLRAVTLITLALGSGLRISELCHLDVGHIASDANGMYVDVQRGKGDKDRQVPIDEDVADVVLHYIAATGRVMHRAADRLTPLFLSRKRHQGEGRLTARHAERIVAEVVARAGIDRKHITPHSLRHSYAIRVLKGDPDTGQPGAPLPALSKLMGHSGIAVTGRYLDHFERAELLRYAPPVRRKKAPEQAA